MMTASGEEYEGETPSGTLAGADFGDGVEVAPVIADSVGDEVDVDDDEEGVDEGDVSPPAAAAG